jgi:hypothetical protein
MMVITRKRYLHAGRVIVSPFGPLPEYTKKLQRKQF